TSLRHNLRAIELADEKSQAPYWNAAIAATGLGDWPEARKLWAACGIKIPEGEGPIEDDYGIAVVRLNPWHGGETVFARRIDPARARLLNVPLQESGHRFGDIVLHDGAATGHRFDGQREVPVFNELSRLSRPTSRLSWSSSAARAARTCAPCWKPLLPASVIRRTGRRPCAITACAAATAPRIDMTWTRTRTGSLSETSALPPRAGNRWRSCWEIGSRAAATAMFKASKRA